MMADKSVLKIKQWNSDNNDTLTEAALVKLLEKEGYRCTRYTYSEGTYFVEHSHSVDKIEAVLKGRFRINLYGQNIILTAGDYIYIPANTLHTAEVTGNESVVSIDAVKNT